jgi:lipoate-protein ligase A
LKSWNWLYGSSPDFKNNLETRFTWGIIDIYFDVEEGMIKKARVFSDAIVIDYITALN